MTPAGGMWGDLVSFRNLLGAAHAAARGKRSRPDVAAFLLNLENEIAALRRELIEGTYRTGEYRTFVVREPKPRLISAAPFRDRVVHHALTRVIEPVFERRFTGDSYACRKGRGTHRALARAKAGARRFGFVLKADVVKYFASIDHEILKALLAARVHDAAVLDLAALVIDGSNDQGAPPVYFPGDTLFTPFERRRGLPLGNQTSQFFANVYLDPLDHFTARRLKPAMYVRYVDDVLLFGDDAAKIESMRRSMEEFLAGLRLRLHPGKSRVYRCRDGVTFLGFRIFPDRTRLVRANVVRARRRLRRLQRAYAAGTMGWPEVRQRVRAWIAHAAHGDTWRLRRRLLAEAVFTKGSAA